MATFKEAVNCCVAALPEFVVGAGEIIVAAEEILLAARVVFVETTGADSVLAWTTVPMFGLVSVFATGAA